MTAEKTTEAKRGGATLIPQCMRDLSQWVNWRLSTLPDGRTTKVPYQPNGRKASTTDPKTWTTFDRATEAASKFSGVGFVFAPGGDLVGVDLDGCRSDSGDLTPLAAAIVRDLDSYTEISQSGHGLHIICRGSLPPGARKREPVEVYSEGRYFVTTGQPHNGSTLDVKERTAQLAALHAKYLAKAATPPATPPAQPADLEDTDLIDRACRAKNGAKFSALWAGDAGDDHSAADQALANLLAFWCGKDPAQMDRLFRRSGLMRDKWDRNARSGETYGEGTIARAIASCNEVYSATDRQRETATGTATPAGLVAWPHPVPLAEDYLERREQDSEGRLLLQRHRGEFYRFDGAAYAVLSGEDLDARLYRHVERARTYARHKDTGEIIRDKSGAPVVKPIIPRRAVVAEIRAAIPSRGVLLSDLTETPCWLDGRDSPRPDDVIVCQNGLLDLPTRKLEPPTPAFFATSGIGAQYRPDAPTPTEWLAFLDDLWGADLESIHTMQEWFGLCLCADTRYQKMLMIVGPTRSGKGTIARVLTALAGQAATCGPTLSSLGEQFGLQPFIGKRLAIISDARLSGRADQGVVTERLLSLSGEDMLTVPRKYLTDWTGQLRARLMLASNELPTLSDASGALAHRFIVLTLTQSWLGREDHGLTDRILKEIDGVLLWAVEGWQRLHDRGRFLQPASATDAITQLADLGSPISAFIRDRCRVQPGASVDCASMFAAWREWCHEMGRDYPGTTQHFAIKLRASEAGIGQTQPRVDGGRIRQWEGITLDTL